MTRKHQGSIRKRIDLFTDGTEKQGPRKTVFRISDPTRREHIPCKQHSFYMVDQRVRGVTRHLENFDFDSVASDSVSIFKNGNIPGFNIKGVGINPGIVYFAEGGNSLYVG